jgi:DNA processing protein
VAQSIVSGCTSDDDATQQQKMREAGAAAITIDDPRYPQTLRDIFDPPVLLFARGRIDLLHSISLGGDGRPSSDALRTCRRRASLRRPCPRGHDHYDGMARVIDTAAHKGALAPRGDAIAVYGWGSTGVCPSENNKLASEIAARGLLLSEYPMGAVAFPQKFPVPNRITSGISVGVMVVEGAQYSGSAVTAKLAMDQWREVFAYPPTSPRSSDGP